MSNNLNSNSIANKLREAGVHSIIYGFGSIAQSAVQFFLLPVLTNAFTPKDFGAYSLLQMASVIAGAIFYLGMTSALPRSYFDYSDETDRKAVFTTAFIILVFGAILQIAFGYIAGSSISNLLLKTSKYRVVVFWAFFGGAISFINQFFFAYLRFLRKSVASIVLSLIAMIGTISLSIYFIRMSPSELSGPFKGLAISQSLVLILFIILFGRKAFSKKIVIPEIKILLKFGIATVFTSIAVMLIDWSDRIYIERMISLEDVAVYSLGYKLGSLINVLIILPFTQIWSPMMIEYRNHSNINKFFTKMISYYFFIGSIVIISAALFVSEFLPLVAKADIYMGAIPIMVIIMIGYLFYGSTNFVSAGLIYERKVIIISIIYYCIAVFKLGVNAFMIKYLGIVGAAITAMLAYVLIPLIVNHFSGRYYKIVFEKYRLIKLLIISVIPLIYVLFIERSYHLGLGFKFLFIFIFFITLFIVYLDREEKNIIFNFLNKRSNYLRQNKEI